MAGSLCAERDLNIVHTPSLILIIHCHCFTCVQLQNDHLQVILRTQANIYAAAHTRPLWLLVPKLLLDRCTSSWSSITSILEYAIAILTTSRADIDVNGTHSYLLTRKDL